MDLDVKVHDEPTTADGDADLLDRVRSEAGSLRDRLGDHQVTLIAAGVAFYAFIALIPGLIAAASIYGIFADPAQIRAQVDSVAGALPDATRSFITSQLRSTSDVGGAGLSVIAVIGLAFGLWSASSGIAALMRGLAVTRGETQPRRFAARRGIALLVTVALIVFMLVAVWMIASAPPLLASITGLGTAVRILLEILRWPLVAALAWAVFTLLYRVSAGDPRDRIVTKGPIVATAIWLAASALFSVYTANFSTYSRNYGSLTVVIVVMLWLYLGALAALVGAEVDAMTALE